MAESVCVAECQWITYMGMDFSVLIIRQDCSDHSCYGRGFSNHAKELKCSTTEEMQKIFCFTWKLLDLEVHGVQNLCQAFLHWAGLAAGTREMRV